MKKCSSCKQEKDLSEFRKDKYSKDGLTYRCKNCLSKADKSYAERNPEKMKARYARYAQENPEKMRAKEKKLKRRAYHRKYQKTQQYRDQRNNRRMERYENDPEYRSRCLISSRLRRCILKRTDIRSKKLEEILGYTIIELNSHLERKFEEGMNWENRGYGPGKWEIDHVIPDSWFQYSSFDDEAFKQSWGLDNLQPLWYEDNQSKHNRFAGNVEIQIPQEEIMKNGKRKDNWREIAYLYGWRL